MFVHVCINEFQLLCNEQEVLINVSMEDKQVQTDGDLISNLTTGSILILDIQVTMVVIILALYIQDLLPISCSYDLYFVLIHTPISKCSSHVFIYINVKWVFFFFFF